jgi:hypothetical protein
VNAGLATGAPRCPMKKIEFPMVYYTFQQRNHLS